MGLTTHAGRQEKHDAFVEFRELEARDERRADPVVVIESPVRDLFGPQQDRAVKAVLAELGVHSGEIHVHDKHALDFVLRARVRAAVERLRANGGRI